MKYIDNSYKIEYELVRFEKGKNAWPAEKIDDKYIFYDKTNQFYFKLYDGVQGIIDYYPEAYNGNIIAKKIKDVFPSNKDFLYEIRCWNNNSKDDFSDASCQLFCFSNEHEKYISNTFEIINYLQQNYNGIRISLIVASNEQYEQYQDLLEYRRVLAMDDMEYTYYKTFSTKDINFSTVIELQNFLQN